ncbi:MAG: hypothetical protein K0R82_495 [Flavipsychrobacter sp.]|jgi:hypothetical protein|nr:hypothetical protein [Flavipsychrobacter sp.]
MKSIFYLAAGIVLSFSIISCEREDPDPIGGKGGNAVLKITPQHHSMNIDSCMVYIKYNTQDKPASFDDSTKCIMEGGKPVATFSNLKKGKYYLFGFGWDPSIGMAVKGGAPYTIKEESSQSYNLAVTEE